MDEITNTEQIVAMLRRLHKGRVLLSVAVPHTTGVFHSAILAIDADAGHLILDELNPKTGHEPFINAGICRVRAELDGVLVAFSTELLETDGENGIAYYRVSLPSSLFYRQRRNHYRVRVGYTRVVPVTVATKSEIECPAEIIDVSFGGLALLIKGAVPPLHRGDVVDSQFPLNPSENVNCRLEICHIVHDPHSHITRVGCRFSGLDPRQRKLLQRFVIELEREIIKKQTKR